MRGKSGDVRFVERSGASLPSIDPHPTNSLARRGLEWMPVMKHLSILLLAGTLLSACGGQPELHSSEAPAPSDPRPNIIIILTDDQRYDALGVLDPALHTPNLDRMVQEGTLFTNAFVTTSLCSPSRASLLTGLPMREHGVIDNNSDLPDNLETFPTVLQGEGYATGMFGKWHLGGEDDSPRPGFDRWVSFAGQGNYYPVSTRGELSYLNVDGTKVPQKGYITDELTDYALDWLDSRKDDSDPFMLYLSHKAVHAYFQPAERHEDQYADVEVKDVTPSLDEMREEPMWVQNQRNSWHGADFPYHTTLSLPEFRRDYYETLSAVDESVGRIFHWLEETGEADNTIVIFLSDNGFLFGEHGLIDKRNAFEESMRIPLIAWGPGRIRAGATETAVVTTLDLKPTLLSVAGAASDQMLEGRSLTPLFKGPADSWNGEVIYEYYWEFNYPHTPTQFAIRTDRYKYVRNHGVWDTDALYDLKDDPAEKINLIADPDYLEIRLDLQKRLHDALADETGKGSVPFSYKFNQGAVFRSPDRSAAAAFPERWMRKDDAVDRIEHLFPDSPDKDETLRKIWEANQETSSK